MSEHFRYVEMDPPDAQGDVLVRWTFTDGSSGYLWVLASWYGGAEGALAAATELHARLTSPLLHPQPDGVEWVRRASAARVRELGWEWFGWGQEWLSADAMPLSFRATYMCRPPQAPQMVAVMAPTSVLAKIIAGEPLTDAERRSVAALTEGDES